MDVNDLLIFVRVAQAGSFTKAARQLGMPVSTVSRRVAELESELGIPLLLRTTRSLRITDAGRAYYEHGQRISAELEKASALATHLQSIPQGLLRVTTTTDFGNHFLGPILREFLASHPQVQADVVLTERVVELIEEGFDLAIRLGELGDSTLQARKLGTIHMQLYASPRLLKVHGEPRQCSELSRYPCLIFTGEDEPMLWRLSGPKGEAEVRVKGRVLSNNMALIRDLALAGEGVALMPHFMCAEDVQAGRLKPVLRTFVNSSGPIHAVYPGHKLLLPRVRAFVDHLAGACAAVQWRSP